MVRLFVSLEEIQLCNRPAVAFDYFCVQLNGDRL